jgi:hypothetical protein
MAKTRSGASGETLLQQEFGVSNPPLSRTKDSYYCDSPASCAGGGTSQFDPKVHFSSQCSSEAYVCQLQEHQQEYATQYPKGLLLYSCMMY